MLSRKTFFITTAIVVVLAIPTVAWALTGPFDTDLPAVAGAQEAHKPANRRGTTGGLVRSHSARDSQRWHPRR